MIWPYFRTGSPGSISASATLWPSPIGSRTSIVRPPSCKREPARDRPGRHGDGVVASQDDGLGIIDRCRHARPLVMNDDF